jgi:Xaa-Pro aminopeptidase
MPLNISRFNRIRKLLPVNKIDIYLVCNPLELRYFLDIEAEGILVIPAQKNHGYFITDNRYQHQIQTLEGKHLKVVVAKKGYLKELSKLINKFRGEKKLGVEGTITLELYLKLKNEFKNLSSLFLITESRLVKDQEEIARIKKAVRITSQAITSIKNRTINKQEKQIKAYLEYQIQSLGGDGSAFPPIVASGLNSAYPHAQPSDKKISRFLLIDCGAKYQGYCADLTRMFFWDKIPKVIKRAYEVVTEAKQLALSLIKEGQVIKNLVVRVEDYLKKSGFKDNIYHGLGHGLGLEVHELPNLNRYNTQELKAGMVITIEPGLYFPGKGGVRCEDVVVVEKNRGVILQ